MNISAKKSRVAGQALTEGLIVFVILGVILMAVTLLGKYQVLAEQTAHASRWFSWVGTRLPLETDWQTQEYQKIYFPNRSHSLWLQPGHSLIASMAHHQQTLSLGNPAQIGGSHHAAAELRKDWGLEGQQIQQSRIHTAVQGLKPNQEHAWLGQASAWNLGVERQLSVLVGAGHASNAKTMQQSPTRSDLAWNKDIRSLQGVGKSVESRAGIVDSPWDRKVEWDWLSAWQGQVPQRALAPYTAP